jgi:spoIIIJ-associated protein
VTTRADRRSEEEEMSIEAQAEMAESFVREVVARFGLTAITTGAIVDDVIQIAVDGDGLGLLIGSRGTTVDALQELTRTVVQRRADEHGNRIQVDVGGYRVRRAAALGDFARQVASEVIESGEAQGLEPMSASDRKIVHDALTDVSGVATSSDGEDPRRYVVVRPVATAAPTDSDPDDDDELDDEPEGEDSEVSDGD